MNKVLLCCCALALAEGGARGQCGDWSVLGNSDVVMGSATGKLVAWDRDGDGPEQELLVAGSTGQVGDLVTTLAGWDGSRWLDLRPGILQAGPMCVAGNDLLCVRAFPREIVRVHPDSSYTSVIDIGMSSQVFDAATVDDAAYVLGRSPTDTSPGWWIRRFDDGGWADIPMSFTIAGNEATPSQLIAWNGTLVVSGNFDQVGGRAADRVAVWDGDSWEALAPYPDSFVVPKIGVFQGELFGIGRVFARRWTGSAWEVPAPGTFPPTGQPGNQPPVAFGDNGVYMPGYRTRFNGTEWRPFDSSVMRFPINAVAWRGTVVCTGYTDYQQYRRYLAIAEGDALVPLGSGVSNEPLALGEWEGGLIAAGVLGAGGRVATPAVRWDGDAWQNIGALPSNYTGAANVSGVCAWNGHVLLGHSQATSPGALMQWDGNTWAAWMPAYWQRVNALGVVAGQPVVLGQRFNQAGLALAAWDGQGWVEIVPTADATQIQHMVFASNGLAVSGPFASMGGVSAGGVAQWDGQSWAGVAGLGDGADVIGIFRGAPVVSFLSAAHWWDGDSWMQVPNWNTFPAPQTGVEYRGDLVLAGSSSRRWSPDLGVRPMGNDEGTTGGEVHAALVAGSSLYLTGALYRADDRPAGWIVRWTDTPSCDCDSIDFNCDGLLPDYNDVTDFLNVFQGGQCEGQSPNDPWPCNSDLDFNNDGLFPDTLDIQAFLSVFSGGPCLQ